MAFVKSIARMMSTNVATFLFAAHSFPYRNCSSARERARCAYIPAGLFINTYTRL